MSQSGGDKAKAVDALGHQFKPIRAATAKRCRGLIAGIEL